MKHIHKILVFIVNGLLVVLGVFIIKNYEDGKTKALDSQSNSIENLPIQEDSTTAVEAVSENAPAPDNSSFANTAPQPVSDSVTVPQATSVTAPPATVSKTVPKTRTS
jgi:hypothetical protein